MKWEDLEPGDILKISNDAAKEWGSNWLFNFIRQELKVTGIIDDGTGTLKITFDYKFKKNIYDYSIFIEPDGRWSGIKIFDIVSLKED